MSVKVVCIDGHWAVRINWHGRRKSKWMPSQVRAEEVAKELRLRLTSDAVLMPKILLAEVLSGVGVAAFNEKTLADLPEPLLVVHGGLQKYDKSKTAVVYFLCKGNELIYVGTTKNLRQRIMCHEKRSDFTFDTIHFITVPQTESYYIESALIQLMKPKYSNPSISISDKHLEMIKKEYFRRVGGGAQSVRKECVNGNQPEKRRQAGPGPRYHRGRRQLPRKGSKKFLYFEPVLATVARLELGVRAESFVSA